MTIKTSLHVFPLLALLVAGCHGSRSMVRSRSSDLSDISHHPRRHVGELVSSYGPVHAIDVKPNGSTQFQVTTPNYAYAFIVDYPGEVPNLEKDKDTYFLGRVKGVDEVNGVDAIKVDAIAIQNTGGRTGNPYAWAKPIYRQDQEETAMAWINGELDLAEDNVRLPRRGRAATVMADDSAPAAQPQDDGSRTYGAPAPRHYAPAPASAPTYAEAPAAYAPAPAPTYAAAPAAPAVPMSADNAGLILVMQKWNTLPSDVKDKILGLIYTSH